MLKKENKIMLASLCKTTFIALMVAFASLTVTSCGSDDEPNNEEGDKPQTTLVTESDLVGEWTLVKNNVLYSESDPKKGDEVIDYSGNSYPRYRYYKISVSEDNTITMAEITASGYSTGDPVKYTLKGNNLVTVEGNHNAGAIENFDPNHSWDNLRIRWNKDHSPIDFGVPVISTYMK